MADSSGKIDVKLQKDGKKDQLVLAYVFTAGDDITSQPTFSVTQTLGWKDDPKKKTNDDGTKTLDLSGQQMTMVVPDSGVKKKGSTYSFHFDLDVDCTDVRVRTYKAPPTEATLDSPDHEDEDQVVLGKNLFNKTSVTVLKVQGGKVEPHVVSFNLVAAGKNGSTYKIESIEGSYQDDNGNFAQKVANATDEKGRHKCLFPPGATLGLAWQVDSLAADTKVILSVARMDFAGKTVTTAKPPENPPADGHVLVVPDKENPDDTVTLTPSEVKRDVTSWTAADGTGTAVFRDQGNFSFYCDLRLVDGSGKVTKQQTICVIGDYPLPVLNNFSVVQNAITPDAPSFDVQVSTANASGHALYVAMTKSDGTLIETALVVDHGVNKDTFNGPVKINASKYPVEETVTVQLAMFGLPTAKGGPKGAMGSSAGAPDPWKIDGEGALWKTSDKKQLKITWSIDKNGAIWLKASNPQTWQWQLRGKMEQADPVTGGTGHFSDPDYKLPYGELKTIAGGLRMTLEGDGSGPNAPVSRGFQDRGHYLVRSASSDGTPDESTLLVAGQFGPDQPDVLRKIPRPGDSNIAISISAYNEDRAGKGFKRIKHWFVLMLENRSYDHMFGHVFPLADGLLNPPDADTADRTDCYSWACEAQSGNLTHETNEKVFARAGARDTLVVDPGHEFANVHYGIYGWGDGGPANRTDRPTMRSFIAPYMNRLLPRTQDQGQWDGDAYDSHNYVSSTSVLTGIGPAHTDRIKLALAGADPADVSKAVMLGFRRDDIPNLVGLAEKYALCDRWFSALPGPTWPNRLFLHCGTSGGLDDSPSPVSSLVKVEANSYELDNIYDLMNRASCEWMIFCQDGHAQANTVQLKSKFTGTNSLMWRQVITGDTNFNKFENFIDNYSGVTNGSFTFLEPMYGALGINAALQFDLTYAFTTGGANSQHPISGAASGDDLIKRVVEIIKRNKSVWEESALIVTHDEHGGFYDHVPPPNAIAPGDKDQYSTVARKAVRSAPGLKDAFDFRRYGVRVPAVIVSPYIPKGVVDHTVYDHTSVMRTVRKSFGITSSPNNSQREQNANDFSHLFALNTPRDD